MRLNLLDLSQRSELRLHASVAADVIAALEAGSVRGFIVGAFARDIHLHYGAKRPIERATSDIDFAFIVRDWDDFTIVRRHLIDSGACQTIEGVLHRLRHRSGILVDLVPFGAIETQNREIKWPDDDTVMDVMGFREALNAADRVKLPGDVVVSVASLPALAILKIVAWQERCARTTKDATDLMLILHNYLEVPGNQERLFSEYLEWTTEDDFDLDRSGAKMLGLDMRKLLPDEGLVKVAEILRRQLSQEVADLPQHMNRRAPELARQILLEMYEVLK